MPTPLITCTFVRSSANLPTDRWHAAIVYVPRGNAEVRMRGVETSIELMADGGDICVANAGEEGLVALGPDALAVVCQVDMRRVRRMVNDRIIWFVCNPTLRYQERYGNLRHCLQRLLRSFTETSDFVELHRNFAELAVVQCLLDGYTAD